MSKEKKSAVPLKLKSFPTNAKFEKIIDPIINTVKVEKRIGPPVPILPDYLKETKCDGNPFTTVKSKRIAPLKQDEKERKDFDKHMYYDFPIQFSVGRNIRNKFNANYDLKKLKYEYDMQEILEENKEINESDKKKILNSKYVSNIDYLHDKRRVCLLDLAIDMKEEDFLQLDQIILKEEELIQQENDRLAKENEEHDQYLKSICHKTSDVIKIAEKRTMRKNFIIENVKRARYNMAHLNADCVKLEEEYLKLKSYKEFLRNCHFQMENRQKIERTSFMDELKLEVMSRLDSESQLSTNDSQMSMKDIKYTDLQKIKPKLKNTNNIKQLLKDSINVENNSNSKKILFTETITDDRVDDKPMVFNKEQLIQLKQIVLSGLNNASNVDSNREKSKGTQLESVNIFDSFQFDKSDSEKKSLDELDLIESDLFFKSPQAFVDLLTELEGNNLSLIENVQEQEEICDHLRSKIKKIKLDMDNQTILIDKYILKEENKIKNLIESINCINDTNQFLKTYNDLDRYKKIFNFGELNVTTPDEMLDYLHEKISIIYHSVFEKVDSTKSNTVEMLKRIESLIDSLYLELQSHDRSIIYKAKKIVDERKREAARLRQKQLTKEAEILKIQKAMIKAQMPPRYQYGRKVVYRSDQPKPVIKLPVIDWDLVREQEEIAFFFT